MATARRPNRPLAVAASVAVLSTLCGRHLYGPTGTALNLYIVCLAETSVGKDRPFKAVYELLDACGYGRLHQTAKIFSVTGFEQLVAETPACTAAVDELATNLLARISNKKASSHEATIKGALQELWSRSIGDGPFKTTRRACVRVTDGPRSSTAIPSPSLTLFGASTPQAFYSALTSGNVEDGFMNRFLIAPAAPRAAKVGGERTPVPSAIVEALCGVPPVMPPPGRGNITGESDVFSPLAAVRERELEWDVGRRRGAGQRFRRRDPSRHRRQAAGLPATGARIRKHREARQPPRRVSGGLLREGRPWGPRVGRGLGARKRKVDDGLGCDHDGSQRP